MSGSFRNLLQKFMGFLESRGRRRDIFERDGSEVYMERYYLLWKSDGEGKKKHCFNVFLHKFLLSDIPTPHSHPWWWISIVLTEGYWEHLVDGSKNWRRPFSIAFRSPNTFHWVELPEGKTPMTLFIHGPRIQSWGFLEGSTFLDWREFIEKYRGRKTQHA